MGTATVSETVLKMTIKRKWYDAIMTQEKAEEYREIKPYWTVRLRNAGLLDEEGAPAPGVIGQAILQNGYGAGARRMYIRFLLRIGEGRSEWGAEPGREYYILSVISRSGAA